MSIAPDFLEAFEALPTASLAVGADGAVLAVNRAARDLLGTAERAAAHRAWISFLRPSERARAAATKGAPRPEPGRWEFSDPSGRAIPCQVAVLPIRGAHPELDLVHLFDSRSADEVRKSLRAREISFRQLAGSVPGALFQYELFEDGRDLVHYVSPGCFEIWELEAEEVEEDASRLWAMVHPDDVEAMRASVDRSAAELSQWIHEWRITTPSGRLKWLEGTGRPTRPDSGSIVWHTFILDVTERRLHDERQSTLLRGSHEQLRSLAAQLQNVREEERNELARELHDQVGQYLTVMGLDLHEIRRSAGPAAPGSKPIEHLSAMLDETLVLVQRLTERLRPPVFEFRGLGAIVATHVARKLQTEKGVRFEVDIESGEEAARRLHPDRALALFRVFQESTTNVLRHARADTAWVRLVSDGLSIGVEVEDDGVGVTEEQIHAPMSLGLIGMRERMHAVGGEFHVGPGRRGGTLSRATLPLLQRERGDLSVEGSQVSGP